MRWTVWIQERDKTAELAGHVTGTREDAEDYAEQMIGRRVAVSKDVWIGQALIRPAKWTPPRPRWLVITVSLLLGFAAAALFNGLMRMLK